MDTLLFILGYVGMLFFAFVMIFIVFNPLYRQSWRNSKFIDDVKKQGKKKHSPPTDLIPRYKGD